MWAKDTFDGFNFSICNEVFNRSDQVPSSTRNDHELCNPCNGIINPMVFAISMRIEEERVSMHPSKYSNCCWS